MIQVSTAPVASTTHAGRHPSPATGDSKGFALALTTLLLPGADGAALPETDGEPVVGRQKAATTGKELPEDAPAKDDEGDAKDGVPFAWFVTVPAPADPAPVALSSPTPRSALLPKGDAPIEVPGLRVAETTLRPETDPAAPAPAIVSALEPALPESAPAPVRAGQPSVPSPVATPAPVSVPLAMPAVAAPTPGAPPVATVPFATPLTAPPVSSPVAATPAAAAPIPGPAPFAAPLTVPPAPVPPVAPAVSQPLAPPPVAPRASVADAPIRQIFSTDAAPAATATVQSPASRIDPAAPPPAAPAVPIPDLQPAAILQSGAAPLALQPLIASLGEAPAPRRAAPRDPLSAAAQVTLGEAARPALVAASAESQQAPLDLRRHEWMGAMLDRIEAMRDAAGTRETSIRLAPDALGSLDVSIRQEGDRVHVHFTAETAAARAALTDAQPRLAELAEARGLRLGQTSVGTGSDAGAAGQGGQRQQPAPSSPLAAPASARTETESADDRIA